MAARRLRFRDWLLSRGPAALGLNVSDLPSNAAIVNAAEERLVNAREGGDAGWWGTWAEILFNVDPADPFISLGRGMARLEWVTVCDEPVPLQNSFYEYLRFGFGRYPKNTGCAVGLDTSSCDSRQGYDRGDFATLGAFTPGRQLRFYPTNEADAGVLRAFVSGLDSNDQPVSGLDGPMLVRGEYVTLATPFAATSNLWNRVDGIQKDITLSPVGVYEFDPSTASLRLLQIMEPTEQVAAYRRYYLHGLPTQGCCPADAGDDVTVQVRALVKLDRVPVQADTDFLLIQNLEALIAEAQAVRQSEMDGPSHKAEARERHNEAIRLLQGELIHREGKQTPAVQFAPFGFARLERRRIGCQI